MRISLLNGTTTYPLAGQSGVAESVHSSASDLQIHGEIAKQTARFVRADHAATWDRKNLVTTVSFGTARVFATVLAAEQWAADYDETFPRSGVLVLASTGDTGVPISVSIGGDMTSDGTTPLVFPALDTVGVSNGRPCFSDPADANTLVYWSGTAWIITTGTITRFYSLANVATPDLVSTWVENSPATGTPVVFGSYPGRRYLLEAVLDPPARQVIGCSVVLHYTATGGRLTNELPGLWSSEIPWPVGGNWED